MTQHLVPPLRAAGLHRDSRRTWSLVDDSGGWVLLELQVDRHATRDRLELTLNTVVWPPGTWPEDQDDALRPHTGANAPFSLRPDDLSRRHADRDHWWTLDHDTDAEALAEDLVRTCVQEALPRARALLDVDVALDALVGSGTRPRPHDLRWAVVMLERAAPDHPRRRSLTAAHVQDWLRDPRPITAGPQMARLLADVGLPVPELPVWWSPVLLPHRVEAEHDGDPVAAWRGSSPQTLVHLADGSQQQGLPPTGLGPYGLRAEDLHRSRTGPAALPPDRRWWHRSR